MDIKKKKRIKKTTLLGLMSVASVGVSMLITTSCTISDNKTNKQQGQELSWDAKEVILNQTDFSVVTVNGFDSAINQFAFKTSNGEIIKVGTDNANGFVDNVVEYQYDINNTPNQISLKISDSVDLKTTNQTITLMVIDNNDVGVLTQMFSIGQSVVLSFSSNVLNISNQQVEVVASKGGTYCNVEWNFLIQTPGGVPEGQTPIALNDYFKIIQGSYYADISLIDYNIPYNTFLQVEAKYQDPITGQVLVISQQIEVEAFETPVAEISVPNDGLIQTISATGQTTVELNLLSGTTKHTQVVWNFWLIELDDTIENNADSGEIVRQLFEEELSEIMDVEYADSSVDFINSILKLKLHANSPTDFFDETHSLGISATIVDSKTKQVLANTRDTNNQANTISGVCLYYVDYLNPMFVNDSASQVSNELYYVGDEIIYNYTTTVPLNLTSGYSLSQPTIKVPSSWESDLLGDINNYITINSRISGDNSDHIRFEITLQKELNNKDAWDLYGVEINYNLIYNDGGINQTVSSLNLSAKIFNTYDLIPESALTKEEKDGNVILTGINWNAANNKTKLIIPNEIDIVGNGVDSLQANGYSINEVSFQQPNTNNNQFHKVVINDNAFANCANLLKFNGNPYDNMIISQVGANAFTGCNQIQYMNFNNLQYNYATQDDIISNSFKIGESAFKDCSSLKNISLPNYVQDINSNEKIANSAFEGCLELQSFELAYNIKEIGDSAFAGCFSLMSIDLTQITKYGNSAFYNCPHLSVLNLENWENTGALDSVFSIDNISTYTYDSVKYEIGVSVQRAVSLPYWFNEELGDLNNTVSSIFANNSISSLSADPSVYFAMNETSSINNGSYLVNSNKMPKKVEVVSNVNTAIKSLSLNIWRPEIKQNFSSVKTNDAGLYSDNVHNDFNLGSTGGNLPVWVYGFYPNMDDFKNVMNLSVNYEQHNGIDCYDYAFVIFTGNETTSVSLPYLNSISFNDRVNTATTRIANSWYGLSNDPYATVGGYYHVPTNGLDLFENTPSWTGEAGATYPTYIPNLRQVNIDITDYTIMDDAAINGDSTWSLCRWDQESSASYFSSLKTTNESVVINLNTQGITNGPNGLVFTQPTAWDGTITESRYHDIYNFIRDLIEKNPDGSDSGKWADMRVTNPLEYQQVFYRIPETGIEIDGGLWDLNYINNNLLQATEYVKNAIEKVAMTNILWEQLDYTVVQEDSELWFYINGKGEKLGGDSSITKIYSVDYWTTYNNNSVNKTKDSDIWNDDLTKQYAYKIKINLV